MSKTRKVGLVLTALTWVGLSVAFVAALSIPRKWCEETGHPASVYVVVVALATATLLFIGAVVTDSTADVPLKATLAGLAVVAITLAAGLGIVVLVSHRTSSWGCG